MTDKEFTQQKKRVMVILDKWRPVLGLSDHRMRYKFIREYHAEHEVAAQCFPLWQYKHHTVEFYMPSLAECDDDSEIEEDILHELVHILVAPASGNYAPDDDALRAQYEYATQSITYALIWAREAGAKDRIVKPLTIREPSKITANVVTA